MSESKNNQQDKEEKIKNHEYDGIQEFDNPLPGWWLATFYITIIFSVFYFGYYSLGTGPTLTEELKASKAQLERKSPPKPAVAWPDEALLLAASKSPEAIQKGQGIFTSKCAACHGDKGQGVIGPNLADSFWIHGKGTLVAVAKVVHDGVNEKGMPPWGSMLKDEEIFSVVAYVKSLRGTNPPNPKAPQGDKVEE